MVKDEITHAFRWIALLLYIRFRKKFRFGYFIEKKKIDSFLNIKSHQINNAIIKNSIIDIKNTIKYKHFLQYYFLQ